MRHKYSGFRENSAVSGANTMASGENKIVFGANSVKIGGKYSENWG